MVPEIIKLTKELSKDKKAVDGLSMDRTSASYKLTYGLKKTIHETTINEIRHSPFSLNIDESTSNNNKHILTVLVNYFSQSKQKVVCEHLAAVEVVKVDTNSVYLAF
jgi:hypothetical protein